MQLIHKIKLKRGVLAGDFEQWVKRTDYRACDSLPNVTAFSVYKADTESDFDYLEFIEITNLESFEKDMETNVFKSLEKDFYAMADVVEEMQLELIPPGYRQG